MRKLLAVALCAAVLAAGLSAPLVHAHPDDHATEHHAGGAVHAHWSGHSEPHRSPEFPGLETADHDRAVFLDALIAVAAPASPAPAVTPAAIELLIPAERAAHRVVEITHGHDPPYSRSRPSRAPPTLLS